MATTLSVLERHGELLEPGSNQVFPIHDPRRVWVVLAGRLDLFLVDMSEGQPVGARHHVLRVEEGQGVFGMSADEHPGLGIVASPAPGTRLVRLAQEKMRALATTPEEKDELAAFVERWIGGLTAAAADKAPPKVFMALEPGPPVEIEDEDKPILPLSGVIWVKHLAGASRFVARDEIGPVDGAHYFPVTRQGWLMSPEGARIECVSFRMLDAKDPEWAGLQQFHKVIFRSLVLNRKETEEKERQRLLRQRESDAALIEGALTQLALPLAEEPEEVALAHEEPTSDDLLLTCRAIGRVAGIRIKAHPDALRGVKQRDPVAAIAKASACRVRRVVLKGQWWRQDAGPLLAFLDSDNRPLALLPHGPNAYDVWDPTTRQATPVTPEIASTFNGFAYVFYRPFPEKALTAGDLLRFGLFGGKRDVLMILSMGAATGVLAMITPFLTGIVFDTVIPGAQRGQLLQLSLFLVVSAVATAMFTLTRSFALLRLEGKMDAAIQAAAWDRLLNLPVPFFRDYTSGDLAMRGLGITQIRQTLTGSTLSSILSGVFSIFSFALLFYYSWRLALLASGLVGFAVLVSLVLGIVQVRLQRELSHVRGRISGMVLQFINGVAKFRVSGTEGRAFASWARQFTKQKLMAVRARKVSMALSVFNAGFPVLSTAAIFYYTAHLMTKPDVEPLTTGDFLAFNAAFSQFLAASLQLSQSIVGVLNIVPLYERAQPIFRTLPEVDVAKTDPGELRGTIDVNHLAFRYRPDAPLVLRDVSLSIRAGEFVAFVGASGCGKSTLFRLLLGFEKPESGAIYYDGHDLAGLDVQAVRRQLGVVLQNGKLLTGDIFTNIVGSAPLTVDDAWEAARLSGLEKDVQAMPMGMHTVIAEGGGGLSGGQRQRLMIARAIVGKPRVLLFDEATSALDNETQAIVSQSLAALQATRVVIAHRLSTIMKADRIFVFDKGLVVQEGSYEQLIAREGLFADLARRQIA